MAATSTGFLTGSAPGRSEDRSRRGAVAERLLLIASWGLLAVPTGIYVASLAAGGPSLYPNLVGVTAPLLYLLMFARLAHAVAAHRGRRLAPLAVLAALLLWGIGGTIFTSHTPGEPLSFPSARDGLFLLAYLGLAAGILLDRQGSDARRLTVWLETAIVCGGAASVAGFVIASPLAAFLGADGNALLVAILYPLLDATLLIVLLGQFVQQRRELTRATVGLLLGLTVLTLTDSAITVALARETLVPSFAVDLAHGAAIVLIVDGICGRSGAQHNLIGRRWRGVTVTAAGAVALLALAASPDGVSRWYVTIPALVTLLSAGARMLLALREAQDAAEARLLSLSDDLTTLPNRRAVLVEIDRRLEDDAPFALLLLDLDGFTEVNDSLGHSAGDIVLVLVSERLAELLDGRGVLARLGGDEFAVVVWGPEAADPEGLGCELRNGLGPPVVVEGLPIVTRASIGVTSRIDGDAEASDLLRRADIALQESKRMGCGLTVYDAAFDRYSRERLDLVAQLRSGIPRGELEVWFQPQVDPTAMRVTSLEALVRWRHPERGLLTPFAFLDDARRAGLMPLLTEAIIRQVVEHARQWVVEDGLDLHLAFNCAPPELLGGSVLPTLYAALDVAGLPPDTLVLEVTEDSFVTDPKQARNVLSDLREHQVQVAIDDYGTGFSSLSYLRDLPVQELKIDRSFVSTVLRDPRNRVIVASTTELAHAVGLRLVAEGVEDAETVEALTAMGVDLLQGYYYAKPMPARDVPGWLARPIRSPATRSTLVNT